MFRFLAGVVTGWTAARLLPPPTAERVTFPTMDEIQTLVSIGQTAFENITNKINKPTK